jgi:type VI secretion system ImpM family protein
VKEPNLRVGCFGKLPFWPEYLEVGVGLATSRGLRGWLHEGREIARMTDEAGRRSDAEVRSQLRFLIGLPGSPDLLAAVLRPSKGRGGREFPFTVFVHFPRKSYGKHYGLIPMALSRVWEELEDAWDSLASLASRESFNEMMESLEVSPPVPAREIRRFYESRQRDPLDELFGCREGASLERLNENMAEVLATLRGRGGGEPTVQLPVSHDPTTACFDASIWIDLVNRHFRLRRFDPCVFLDGRPSQPDRQVLLKYGPLGPSDYSVVMGLNGASKMLHRPAATPEGVPPGTLHEGLTYSDLLGRRFNISR